MTEKSYLILLLILSVMQVSASVSSHDISENTSENTTVQKTFADLKRRLEMSQTNQSKAQGDFDHSEFDTLLKKHVKIELGRVDYRGLIRDHHKLDNYLSRIANVDFDSLTSNDQFALLINAYNAYTLKLILENYPVSSIIDIEDPWKSRRYIVGGYRLSLDDIEHQLIRPIYKDPRIHFALNCAAIDCPPLQPFAFVGDKLKEQLDEVARNALNSKRFVDVDDGVLRVTKLMEWYEQDFVTEGFVGYAPSISAYILRYIENSSIKTKLQNADSMDIKYMGYNWQLNDIARK